MREAKFSLSSFSERALDLLFPPKCALCDVLGPDPICGVCRSDFEENAAPYRRTLDGGPVDYVCCVYTYHGRAGHAVRRLKYSRSTSLAAPMASMIAEAYDRHGLSCSDVVVPIPIHWSRRCTRGFNQAELLAQQIPSEAVRPHLLWRLRPTRPQAGLSREERVRNLQGAFAASPMVEGLHVLLIDDVVTSGHTASVCAAELKSQGAKEVGILSLAGDTALSC
jgi:ComF family protein